MNAFRRLPSVCTVLLGALLATSISTSARAQATSGVAPQAGTPATTDDQNPPDTDHAQAFVKPSPDRLPSTAFLMPDVPDGWNQATSYDGRLWSMRFSFVTLIDFNAFTQDDDSLAQVAEQRDEWDVRT